MGVACPGEAIVCDCGRYYWNCYSPVYAPPDNNAAWAALYASYAKIMGYLSTYAGLVWDVFHLEDDIEELESDIADLECNLASAESSLTAAEGSLAAAESQRDIICSVGPGPACNAATAAVASDQAMVDYWTDEVDDLEQQIDDKTQEKEDKEAEKEVKEAERKVQRDASDAEAQVWWGLQDGVLKQIPDDIRPHDLFPTMSEPWGDYWEDTRVNPHPKFVYSRHTVGHFPGTWSERGSFTPGGFPYNDQALDIIKRTCCESRYSQQQDCSCYAWKQVGMPCEGKEDSYRLPANYYVQYQWYGWGPLTEGCDNAQGGDDIHQLSLEVFPAPDYTRPPE